MLHEIIMQKVAKGEIVFGVNAPIPTPASVIKKVTPRATKKSIAIFQTAVKFQIDNVAEWFWTDDREVWDLADEEFFPNMAPPYNIFWMEYETPRVSVSNSKTVDMRHVIRPGHRTGMLLTYEPIDNGGWHVFGFMFSGHKHDGVEGGDIVAHLVLNPDGTLSTPTEGERTYELVLPPRLEEGLSRNTTQEVYNEAISGLSQHIKPPMLAVCLMHTNNSIIVDHTVPLSKAKRKRLAREGQKIEPVTFKTIHITPMQTKVQRRGGVAGPPTGRTIERRRAHFRTYGKDGKGKLFGKWSGTWFWSPITPDGERDPLTDPDYIVRI